MASDGDQDHALDRLNTAERELLLLLGGGHTAKSIAALKGLTELAVNERFRSARRKTGVASSREIARLLIARENRHDFIGLAGPAASVAPLPRPDAPRRASPIRWRLPMTAAVLLAAAILAQQTATPPAPPNRSVHPAAEAMFETRPQAPDFGVLHAEVAASQPDPEWSPRTEAALSRTFQALPGFSTAMEAFTVTCSASLCEAVGVTRTGLTTDQINEVMGGVQSRTVDEAAAQLRIDAIGTRFSSTRDDSVGDASTASIFAAYWRRRP